MPDGEQDTARDLRLERFERQLDSGTLYFVASCGDPGSIDIRRNTSGTYAPIQRPIKVRYDNRLLDAPSVSSLTVSI